MRHGAEEGEREVLSADGVFGSGRGEKVRACVRRKKGGERG